MVRRQDKENVGFQLELVPGTDQKRHSQRYRLTLEWGAQVEQMSKVSTGKMWHHALTRYMHAK